jgi:hypothetical protein
MLPVIDCGSVKDRLEHQISEIVVIVFLLLVAATIDGSFDAMLGK